MPGQAQGLLDIRDSGMDWHITHSVSMGTRYLHINQGCHNREARKVIYTSSTQASGHTLLTVFHKTVKWSLSLYFFLPLLGSLEQLISLGSLLLVPAYSRSYYVK